MSATGVDARAREFFDRMWASGDPWRFESEAYERDKYACQLAMLEGRRYARALEIGCGAGVFSRQLATVADRVLAIDVSPQAIARAGEAPDNGRIEYRAIDVMAFDPAADGPWDLIVMSETIYYLGWLYTFFDVAWLAHQLCAATRPGGALLMANTCGGLKDYLLQPWSIRTYHDLFVNVGFAVEREEIFAGTKDDLRLEALVMLFSKPATRGAR